MVIHSGGQTIFSFPHTEGITLGADEEVDEIAGGGNPVKLEELKM